MEQQGISEVSHERGFHIIEKYNLQRKVLRDEKNGMVLTPEDFSIHEPTKVMEQTF